MTVKEAVLKVILKHYPKVKNHLIHRAHPKHPLSGGQRLRDLRYEGVEYEFKHTMKKGRKEVKCQHYDFSMTPKRQIRALLTT